MSAEFAAKEGKEKTLRKTFNKNITNDVQKTAVIERKDSWNADRRIIPS